MQNFLGVFAIIVKIKHFAQVINFLEIPHWKIHPRKIDENNRESAFFLLSFFRHNSKTKFIVYSFNKATVKTEVCCPFFFAEFVSQMSYLLMRLQRVQIT